MQNLADAILKQINGNDNINILTAPTHERYQSNLESLPFTFWMIQEGKNTKPWNHWAGPVPKNHVLLPDNKIPNGVTIDLVLSQNKFGQAQLLHEYVKRFQCPWINIEHTWPHPDWPQSHIHRLKDEIRADVNIFISEQSCRAWLFNPEDDDVLILRHGLDTDQFVPADRESNGKILTVANDYINRDVFLGYSIYQQATYGLPTRPVGDTKGLSVGLPTEKVIEEYQSCGVFLNTSTHSPIPCSLIEAASCATPIVCNNTCACPDLIEDGVNGFLFNTPEEAREKLIWCLENPKDAKVLGEKARNTVIEKFSLQTHLKNWTEVINKTVQNIGCFA